MTSYLIRSENPPFTAADICAELGIDDQYVELLVASAIASTCVRQHARTEVYAVTVTPRFDEEIVWASGRRPTEVGPEYDLPGYGRARDCHYAPSAERVAKARETVVNWVLNSNDRNIAAALRDGEPARRVSEMLKQQLAASLAEAV